MSYDTLKVTLDKEPITVVQLFLDRCSRTFGVAPCTASLLNSPFTECFNTRQSCQDTTNYLVGATSNQINFIESRANLPPHNTVNSSTHPFYPCITGVVYTPAKITPGKGLGYRGTVQVTMQDFSNHDRGGIDPYVANRSYSPMEQGTFFGKLMAREKYMLGRIMYVRTGYLTSPLDFNNFKTRVFFIEAVHGPDKDGKFEVVGKDLLSKVLREKAQAPKASSGLLNELLTVGDVTTLTLDSGSGSDYPTSNGVVKVDKELIRYATRSGDLLGTLTRGVGGTTAAEHALGASVQNCLEYSSVNVRDIIEDLLVNYADIPSIYIPTAEWDAEEAAWLTGYSLTTIITTPTSVETLVSELCEQCMLDLWWDEVDQDLKLASITPAQGNISITEITDADVIANSVKVRNLESDFYTEVWFAYGVINYVENLTNFDNYSQVTLKIDLDAEGDDRYNEKRIKKIYSRWLTAGQSGIALQVSGRLLNRYVNTPQEVAFEMDIKDDSIEIGSRIQLTTRFIQDFYGAAADTQMQILSSMETIPGHRVKYVGMTTVFQGLYAFIGPNTLLDYTAESSVNKQKYAFIANNTPTMSDGSAPYLII